MAVMTEEATVAKRQAWTPEDLEYLRSVVGTMTSAEAAQVLGRTHTAVKNICSRHGIVFRMRGQSGHRSRVWTKQEITYLMGLAENMSMDQAAKRLGRSVKSVGKKAYELRISFRRGRLTLEDLAEIIGVSSRTVYMRRKKLNLKFRTCSRDRASITRGPNGADIVAIAQDILNDPPKRGLPNTSAKKLRQVIEEYRDWEP